jgi:4-azaleucine resistance transporter AzlC
VPGVIPFGVIYGVLGVTAGLPPLATQAMSAIVFAGSAQFISAQMFRDGAPALIIVLTVLVVNLRHLLYSASVQPYLQHLHPRWKWLLAYLLTDEAYATTIVHYQQSGEPAHKHWFFLGAGLTLWTSWQASTLVGVVFGSAAQIPVAWALDFTLALTFIGLVFASVKDQPALAAALSAGALAVSAHALPYKLGLMLAALTGILVGLMLEERQPQSKIRNPKSRTP